MFSALFLYIFLSLSSIPINLNGENISIPVYSNLTKQSKITLLEDYSYELEINQVTTIYDSKGLSHASQHFIIDQFTSLDNFEVKVVNPNNGKTIKKYKTKDLEKRALIDNGSIYQDLEVMYFTPEASSYPIKVEMTARIKKSGNFYFPSWNPQNFHHQKVEQASLEVNYPKALGIRYKTQLFEGDFNESSDTQTQTLLWTTDNHPPSTTDAKDTELTKIKLAPVKFGMDGFEASMDTWENFGLWFYQLNKERTSLPEEFKQGVKLMVKDAGSDIEKIQILYKYLQNNYRYVSIQLGIGGWRPMESAEVLSKKYGDCKGLTLFMKAMLSEVGISADYTLVNAGKDTSFDEGFPSNQFNHAILRINSGKNRYWLECTSNHLPAGFLGAFTKNRKVLVITPEGGKIDHTPSYSDPVFNTTKIITSIMLMEDGNAKIEGSLLQQGFPAETVIMKTFDKKEKEINTIFNEQIGVNGLLINELSLDKIIKWKEIATEINFSGVVLRYFRNTNKRVFIPMSWFNWKINMEAPTGNYVEEISIKKHRALDVESIPKNITINKEKFDINLEIAIDEENILIKRHIKVKDAISLSSEEQKALLIAINETLKGELILTKQ